MAILRQTSKTSPTLKVRPKVKLLAESRSAFVSWCAHANNFRNPVCVNAGNLHAGCRRHEMRWMR